MDCWSAINKAMDMVTKEFVPTPYVEVLIIAEDVESLRDLKERVTNYVSPVAVRFNYLTVSKLTPCNIRGRTRLMVIKELGVYISPDIERSLILSLISASRNCVDVAPEDLIFTV